MTVLIALLSVYIIYYIKLYVYDRCVYVVKERKRLENLMNSRVKGWHEFGENEKVVKIMDRACCDEAVGRAVEGPWKKRFVADAPIPHQT